MKKSLFKLGFFAGVSALALVAQSEAHALTFQTFTDLASWQAAVNGTTTLETFDTQTVREFSNPINETGFNGFNLSGIKVGDRVGIKNGSFGANINGTSLLGYNGRGNGPTINFDLLAPTNAFAFDWKDTDPTDEASLIIAGTQFFEPPTVDPGTGSGFFGVVATDGFFSQATWQHSNNTEGGFIQPFGIDNVRTGGAAPVPTPALLPGLIGMGLTALRKKRKQAEIA